MVAVRNRKTDLQVHVGLKCRSVDAAWLVDCPLVGQLGMRVVGYLELDTMRSKPTTLSIQMQGEYGGRKLPPAAQDPWDLDGSGVDGAEQLD
jgi:hypothetical protein